jgi:hypothetical protein
MLNIRKKPALRNILLEAPFLFKKIREKHALLKILYLGEFPSSSHF